MSERDDAMEAVADMESGPETSRITHLFAGVPVSDLDASIGRPRDALGDGRARLALHRAKRNAGGRGPHHPGRQRARRTPGRVAVEGIEHEPVETYSNGVRHVKIPDPDGNAIAFAEPPDAT